MNLLTPISIVELQSFLAALKDDTVLIPGFANPHIYRGNDSCPALVPVLSTTVGELKMAISDLVTNGVRSEYDRRYRFNLHMQVFVAQEGHFGVPMTMGTLINAVESWSNLGLDNT